MTDNPQQIVDLVTEFLDMTTSEQETRIIIDGKLQGVGWGIQDYSQLNPFAFLREAAGEDANLCNLMM